MQFEVIRKSHKKKVVIGSCVFIAVIGVLLVKNSFAKYQAVKSFKIVEGTINYKIPDFKIMAMYQQKAESTCTTDNCYEGTNTMPSAQSYIINETKSYCTLDNQNKETGVTLKTTNGNHVIKGLNKNSKCYLYFDNIIVSNAKEIIASKELLVRDDFSETLTEDTTGKMYITTDYDGTSYYYAGAPTDNYVKFADKYWRIVRINGDGSIRLIYDGTSAHVNGSRTSDSIAIASQGFNSSIDNNMYVGFMYTSGQAQGTGTKSNALTQLETWYTNNLASYADKIDTNAGFCGDRRRSLKYGVAPNGSGGTGTTTTYYGASYRLSSNKSPELSCEAADFYTTSESSKGNKALTYSIGLITADEVAMAGGLNRIDNNNYYLYNGQSFWTMSPYRYMWEDAYRGEICYVSINGSLSETFMNDNLGIRPVINLKFTTTLTGKGTASDPYVVQ